MARVFFSYVKEDQPQVLRLATTLEKAGAEVWVDKLKLRPGERWPDRIRRAIKEGDFFIACFSHAYTARTKTYMNEELTLAIDELRQRPTDRAWFIPVLLSPCEIPDRSIGAGETLGSIHAVYLYDGWDDGVRQILDVVLPSKNIATEYELRQVLPAAIARRVIAIAPETAFVRRNYHMTFDLTAHGNRTAATLAYEFEVLNLTHDTRPFTQSLTTDDTEEGIVLLMSAFCNSSAMYELEHPSAAQKWPGFTEYRGPEVRIEPARTGNLYIFRAAWRIHRGQNDIWYNHATLPTIGTTVKITASPEFDITPSFQITDLWMTKEHLDIAWNRKPVSAHSPE